MSRIQDFKTEHFFVPGSQIERWNQGKIALPEGAGHQYIAPSDLTATLIKPFFYNDYPVYNQGWVNKEISHFPYCRELLEINDGLKQYGWCIPTNWATIVEGISHEIIEALNASRGITEVLGTPLHHTPNDVLAFTLQNRFNLKLSGSIRRSKLGLVNESVEFWAVSELPPSVMCITSDEVNVLKKYETYNEYAFSVRCVSIS